MPTFTVHEYLLARIPDLAILMPGFNDGVATNAAMALYWDFFPQIASQSPIPDLDETLLTERQKSLVGLRAALALLPVVTKLFTRPQVTEAGAGPAMTKLEERNKIYRACLPLWVEEVKRLEISEGIFYDIVPNVPAFLLKLQESCELKPFCADRGATSFEPIVFGIE